MKKVQTLIFLILLSVSMAAVAGHINGSKYLSVQSGSMAPAIEKGHLVVVNSVPVSQLAVGDVITFTNPNNSKQTITHRIVELPNKKHPNQLITKGDANAITDAPISINSIVGRASYSTPYLGRFVDFVRQPIGLALLIYLPALIIVIGEIRRLGEYYRLQQPYFLKTMFRREKDEGMKSKITGAATLGVISIMVCSSVYLPVKAMLSSSATLGSNTISATVPSENAGKVLFREFTLRCSRDNTASENKRPEIILYNPTKQNIDIGGWKIADNNGTILTIQNGKVLKKHRKLSLTPFLSNGLQYAGDRLVLLDNNNQPVDGLSWGTDTTQFNAALQTMTTGDRAKRKTPKLDTNQASDWRVHDYRCHNIDDEGDDHNDCFELDRTVIMNFYHMQDREPDPEENQD